MSGDRVVVQVITLPHIVTPILLLICAAGLGVNFFALRRAAARRGEPLSPLVTLVGVAFVVVALGAIVLLVLALLGV